MEGGRIRINLPSKLVWANVFYEAMMTPWSQSRVYEKCLTRERKGYKLFFKVEAGIAQLVEYKLPKLGVAGSNPVARSTFGVTQCLPFSLFEAMPCAARQPGIGFDEWIYW